MPFGTVVVPESLRWWGWGKETVAGTVAAPVISMPLMKGEPENKITMLPDKSLYGDMAEDHGDIQGVEIADFPLSGDVYLDTIGYPLLNLWGDYQATGTAGTPVWTATAGVTAGAGPITVTSGTAAVQGTFIQIGSTAPTEIVKVGAGSTVTSIVVDPTTPIRFTHTGSTAITTVTAPFTHVFSLRNDKFGQPDTHTLTYFNDLSGSFLARQYAYWCCSGIDFKMTPDQLFQHDTKGTALMGALATATVTNVQSGLVTNPAWTFKVGIGGPASGGTLVSNVLDSAISYTRGLKPQFTLQGAQAPFIIPRLGLAATGKLTFMAQDEVPLLAYLANTQQPLQVTMSQGAGASQVGITFDFNQVAYEVVQNAAPDVLTYDVTWRAIANTTNAGQSGGRSPGKVTLVNAIPTY